MLSENNVRMTKYFCTYCSKQRILNLDMAEHERLLSLSPNGLRLFSDIHKCKDSQIEAVNLSIDADYNIRSQELLKIPEYKVMNAYSIPMPSLKKNQDDAITIRITHFENHDLRLILDSSMLQTTIIVGDIDESEDPLFTQTSTFEGIELKFYKSKKIVGPHLTEWFQFFVDTLEILPPSHLGNLLEVLDYICERHKYEVQNFDREFVRTILASHEVYVMLKDNVSLQYLKERLSHVLRSDDFQIVDTYLQILEEMKAPSVSHLLNLNAKNYIHQLYIILIMEKEGFFQIDRPGIVKD